MLLQHFLKRPILIVVAMFVIVEIPLRQIVEPRQRGGRWAVALCSVGTPTTGLPPTPTPRCTGVDPHTPPVHTETLHATSEHRMGGAETLHHQ